MPICLPSFAGVAQPASGGGGEYNILSGSFDGTDDYLTTNESNLATSGDCTISLWFNSASLPGNGAYDYMFSLTDSRATGKDRAIGIRGTGTDAQIVANTYASGWNLPFTNTSISASTWYHVAVVFTSGSAQVYFNGADKGSKSVATSTIAYTQTVIGGMLYSSANQFNGKIDEVSVFHSALSSTNITAIYNSGVPADISTLSPKGWWRNGDGTGDTDSGGGTPANTDTVGTVANQGSVNTGSGEGNMTGTNGATFSTDVPVVLPSITNTLSGSFDGSDDYLLMGTSAISLDTNFTISVWFKPTSDALAGYDFMCGWGNNASGESRVMQILNSKLSFEIYFSRISGATTLSADTWYHGAVTFSGNDVEIFLNGSSDGSGTLSRSSMTSSLTFAGGTPAMTGVGFVPFSGLIDEFAVFDSVLSSTAISVIYNSGVPNDISSLNPVGWWRMGDGTGDTDSGGGTPANTDTIGTVVNQGSASNANGTGTNGSTFSTDVPS